MSIYVFLNVLYILRDPWVTRILNIYIGLADFAVFKVLNLDILMWVFIEKLTFLGIWDF